MAAGGVLQKVGGKKVGGDYASLQIRGQEVKGNKVGR